MKEGGLSHLYLSSRPDEDLEHVVGALLSMPSTPTLQPSSANQSLLNDEDVDIFTMLLNEMDSTTPRPASAAGGSLSITPSSGLAAAALSASVPQQQYTPGADMQELTTAFTWADAMASDALLHTSSFFLDSTVANNNSNHNNTNFADMPSTPTFGTLSSSLNRSRGNINNSSSASIPPPPPASAWTPTPLFGPMPTQSASSSSGPATVFSTLSSMAASGTKSSKSVTKPNTTAPTSSAAKKPKATPTTTSKTSPPPALLDPFKPTLSSLLGNSNNNNGKKKQLVIEAPRSSDDGEGDGDDNSTIDDGDVKLSPRSHAIREKNREAVRKCRQKKKEREDSLNERIRLLENENEEIRVQLRLGSEDRAREMEMETNRRAKRLEDLLALSDTNPSPELDDQLREACESYMLHSQERAEDRSAALSGALSRVARLIDPTIFAKFYLWHGTAKDDYFTNPNGLWASISAQMDLTEDQTERLSKRREKLQRLRLQIMDVSAKLSELQTNVSLKEKIDVDGLFQRSISSLMTPRQLAKFILWVRNDPAVRQVTDSTQMLSSFLNQVTEPPSNDDFAHVVKARDEAAENAAAQSKKSRLELARERIIILTKGLWDAPKETLESIANQGLTPNVTLIDPNNGGEYHGIAKTLQYVHRIRLAFGEKISVDLREMSMDNDKARATWVLQGTYRGRLGANSSSAEQKHLKHVSFVIVCTYTFQPGSTLIQEMLVAWDAIGLMRQIGLLKGNLVGAKQIPGVPLPPQIQAQQAMGPPPPKRARMQPMRFEDIQATRMRHVEDLAKMFAASSYDEMVQMAREILHSGCVFQDSYMGFEFRGWENCAKYAQKVRSPFPTLSVTGVKMSENEGAALGSPLRLDWTIRAKYSGPLVPQLTDCSFNAVLFVTFDDQDHTIDSVHFSWNAQRLMDQLGIQRKN